MDCDSKEYYLIVTGKLETVYTMLAFCDTEIMKYKINCEITKLSKFLIIWCITED